MIGEVWMKWAGAEGLTKTGSRLLEKFVGVAGQTTGGAFMAALITGCVQMIGGFVGAFIRSKSLWSGAEQVRSALIFGVSAALMDVLSYLSFAYGADIGITTFIIVSSIVPGAFVDWMFFKHPLLWHQWVGVLFFLFSGWAILGFPSFAALMHLPIWVWIIILVVGFTVLNEAITQKLGLHKGASEVDPLVNNFWIGLATLCFSALGIIVLGMYRGWEEFFLLSLNFFIASGLIGGIVIAMISFKLLSYQSGGTIALKKFVTQAVFLGTATFIAIPVFGEELTSGKIIGVLGFLVTFVFMDKGTWQSAKRLFAN